MPLAPERWVAWSLGLDPPGTKKAGGCAVILAYYYAVMVGSSTRLKPQEGKRHTVNGLTTYYYVVRTMGSNVSILCVGVTNG